MLYVIRCLLFVLRRCALLVARLRVDSCVVLDVLSFVVCCLLFVVRCVLYVVCFWVLLLVCCSLDGVRCVLFGDGRCVFFVVCSLLFGCCVCVVCLMFVWCVFVV